MNPIVAIARNTVREAVRERIAIVAVAFGAALVAASQVLSPLALGVGPKIITDFGLAGSSLLATLLAITLGSTLLHKELERRTVYAIMAKPIRRADFLLGKFGGLWVTSAGLLLLMSVMVMALVGFGYREAPWVLTGSILLTLIELGIVTALVVFYSSFTTPGLTAFFAAGSVLAGHFSDDLLYFGKQGGSWALELTTTAVYWLLPHLSVFNARGLVSHGEFVPLERILFAASYGLLYLGGLLIAACAIWDRRELR